MGWQLFRIFGEGLIDHFWWLLGTIFMVEPWLDSHIERYRSWADNYLSRPLRARLSWTVSFFCLFIASMWAFSDEYWRHQGDVSSLNAAIEKRDKLYEREHQKAEDLWQAVHRKGGYLDQISALQNRPPKTIVRKIPSPTIVIPSGNQQMSPEQIAAVQKKRIALGDFLSQGNKLANLAAENGPDPIKIANEWAANVEKYLLANFDASYVQRFRDSSNINPRMVEGLADKERRNEWCVTCSPNLPSL